jgi:hypothetical protein
VNFVNNSIGLGPATSAGSSESINDIVRLPNGQWLVTGNFNSWDSSGPPDSPSEFLYRLQANGSLDNTFAPRFNVVPLAVQYWPAVGQSMAVGNFGLARSSAGSLSSAQSIAFLDGSTGYLAANPLNGSYEAQTLIRGSFVDSKGRLWIYGDFGVHLNHQRQVAIEVFETNGKRLQQFPRFSSEN